MKVYKRNGVVGGTSTDLDFIDGNLLADKDFALVLDDATGTFSPFELDADSGSPDDGESVIAPLTNAGTKRWIRRTMAEAASLDALKLNIADINTRFAGNSTANGYQKFNNGITIQWGETLCSATPGAAVTVPFNIAFTAGPYAMAATGKTTNTSNAAAWISTVATTSFNIRAALAGQSAYWIAIGFIAPA